MFSIKEFSEDLDLTSFYKTAKERGYYNNCNQEVLHDNMKHLDDYKTYLLYWDKTIVGSVCLHSLEELNILGDNAYRVGARTCLFPDLIGGVRKFGMQNYSSNPFSHYTTQLLFPACIKYCGINAPMYVSTNENETGTQIKVHRIWTKVMHRLGYLIDPVELDYRNNFQTFWKINTQKWINDLRTHVWPEAKFVLEGM